MNIDMRQHLFRLSLLRPWVLCFFLATGLYAQQTLSIPDQAISILKANCQTCHSQANRSSGLAFDTRDDVLKGGRRGPAIKPGAPSESLLIHAVEQSGEI